MVTTAPEPTRREAPADQTWRVLENFEDFLNALRALGFVVTVDHYLHVQTVLDRLGSEATDERLKTLLCPLFATSAERQKQFYEVFRAYQQAPRPDNSDGGAPEDEGDRPESSPGGQTRWQKIRVRLARARRLARRTQGGAALALWRRGLVGTLFLLVAMTALLFAWSRWHPHGAVAKPIPHPVPAPVPWNPHPQSTNSGPLPPAHPPPVHPPPAGSAMGPTKTFILQVERGLMGAKMTLVGRYRWWPWAAGAALLALPFLVGSLGRRLSKDGRADHRTSPYRDILSPRPPPSPYQTPELSRAARALRRREDDEVQTLDMPASIRATVNALGYPTLRFRHLSRIPEYLVLIDRAGYGDQQARLFDALTDALRAEGLYVQRYFFDGAPDFLIRADTGERARLADLRGLASDHVLILCGGGELLIDPFTGKLHEWTAVCEGWSRRVVLTPIPAVQWGARERVLARRFRVLPATVGDLGQLFENPDRRRPVEAWGPGPPWREDWEGEVEAPMRWLQTILAWPDPAPDPAQPAAPAFVWLCACALTPTLHWDLTLRLGMRLADLGLGPMREEDLLRLARLPYFRQGVFPPDLRLALIRRLTLAQAQVMRAEVLAALGEEPLPPPGSYAADVRRLELAAQAWLLRQGAAPRRALKEVLRTLPRSQVLSHPGLLPQLEQGGFWGPGRQPPLSLSGPAPWWRTPALAAGLALLGGAAAWLPFLPGRAGPTRIGASGPLAFGNVPAGQTAHIAVALNNPAGLALHLQNTKIENVPLANGGTGTFVAANVSGHVPLEPTLLSVPFEVYLGDNTVYLGVDYALPGSGGVKHATFPITVHGTSNPHPPPVLPHTPPVLPHTPPVLPHTPPVKRNRVIPGNVQALIAKLKSRDPRERSDAASALGQIGAPAAPAVPALTATLNDPDSAVRAAARNALQNIRFLAGQPPADLNKKDSQGWTALYKAVHNHDLNTASALLAQNAAPNIADNNGWTPLMLASTNGNANLVNLLLKNNAEPKLQNNKGETALHWAASTSDSNVAQMLLNSGALLGAADQNGDTPLGWAAHYGQDKVIDFLLSKNADPNAKDAAGQTPLHRAVAADKLNAVISLLNAKRIDVNAKDNQGKTPLDLATFQDIVDVLRAAGGTNGAPLPVQPGVGTFPPATVPPNNPTQQAAPLGKR